MTSNNVRLRAAKVRFSQILEILRALHDLKERKEEKW